MESFYKDAMPFWRIFPYDNGGVFELDTLNWDKDILTVDLALDYTRLPTEYSQATGQIFWDEVRLTVLAACPESKQSPHLPDLDYDMHFALGAKDDATFQRIAVKVKQALEQKARQVWLRPGVPHLHAMVTQYLSKRENLVMSLLEFQRKHGYSETRQLVDQFRTCLSL